MGMMTPFTLSTASADMTVATAWMDISGYLGYGPGSSGMENRPTGDALIAAQGLSIQATTTNSAGTGTLYVAWVYTPNLCTNAESTVIKIVSASLSARTDRSKMDGSTGDYVGDVTIGSSVNGTLDLLPYGEDKDIRVLIGLKAISASTSWTFYINSTGAN